MVLPFERRSAAKAREHDTTATRSAVPQVSDEIAVIARRLAEQRPRAAAEVKALMERLLKEA